MPPAVAQVPVPHNTDTTRVLNSGVASGRSRHPVNHNFVCFSKVAINIDERRLEDLDCVNAGVAALPIHILALWYH